MRALLLFLFGVVVGAVFVNTSKPTVVALPTPQPLRLPPVEAALDLTIEEVDLVEVPLREAVARVADLSKVSIKLDEDQLRADGVDPNTPITLKLRGCPLGFVVCALVNDENVSRTSQSVGVAVVKSGLLISSYTALRQLPAETRLYEVADILEQWETISPAFLLSIDQSHFFARTKTTDLHEALGNSPCFLHANTGLSDPSFRQVFGKLQVSGNPVHHWMVRQLLDRFRAYAHAPTYQPPGKLQNYAIFDPTTNDWTSAESREIEQRLFTVVPEFRYKGTRRDALLKLGQAASIAIHFARPINPQQVPPPEDDALAAVVDMGQRNSLAGDILRELLRDEDGNALTWWYASEKLVIGPREAAKNQTILRSYDMRSWYATIAKDPNWIRLETERPSENRTAMNMMHDLYESIENLLEREGIEMDWPQKRGRPFLLTTYGAWVEARQTPEGHYVIRRYLDDVRRRALLPRERSPEDD